MGLVRDESKHSDRPPRPQRWPSADRPGWVASGKCEPRACRAPQRRKSRRWGRLRRLPPRQDRAVKAVDVEDQWVGGPRWHDSSLFSVSYDTTMARALTLTDMSGGRIEEGGQTQHTAARPGRGVGSPDIERTDAVPQGLSRSWLPDPDRLRQLRCCSIARTSVCTRSFRSAPRRWPSVVASHGGPGAGPTRGHGRET